MPRHPHTVALLPWISVSGRIFSLVTDPFYGPALLVHTLLHDIVCTRTISLMLMLDMCTELAYQSVEEDAR